jgi:hypothetical protein
MSKARRGAIPILVAGPVLYLAGWLDGSVIRDVQRQTGATFDPSGLALALSLGSLAVAGSVLLLGVLAWRSHLALVGVVYALVGAFFAFLLVINWRFAAQINDTPPVLPEPIALAVNQIYFWSAGPLNAVETIGAGMMIVGLLVLGRTFRDRSVDQEAEPLSGVGVLPIHS